MAFDERLLAWVEDALEPMGRLTFRRMMGGAILYLDGVVFALIDDDEIWFKSDAEADAIWDVAGCDRFRVTFRDGRVDEMNYRRAPADVHDDAQAMRDHARLALAAGGRAAAKRRPRRAKVSSPPPA